MDLDQNRIARLRQLAATLGHEFRDLSLLDRALTHSSLGNEGLPNYERLEFFGDAILDFVVAEELYRRHPETAVGGLTEARSRMVSRDPLAEVGDRLRLGDYLLSGKGLSPDTLASPRIREDLVEAVLAAIYLDGGLDAAQRFVVHHILAVHDLRRSIDAKTKLNHMAQAAGLTNPVYRVIEQTGLDHEPAFRVAVSVRGMEFESDPCRSKRSAEQQAAERAMATLQPGPRADGSIGQQQD